MSMEYQCVLVHICIYMEIYRYRCRYINIKPTKGQNKIPYLLGACKYNMHCFSVYYLSYTSELLHFGLVCSPATLICIRRF